MWIRVNLINATDTMLYGMRKTLPDNLHSQYWFDPKPGQSSVFIECTECKKEWGPSDNLDDLKVLLKGDGVLK